MKTTILATILLFTFSQVFGQDIKIAYTFDLNTDISGTEVEVVGDKNGEPIYIEFRVINDNPEPIEVRYQRKRLVNSGLIDAICDNNLCIDADDTYSWTTPILNTISAGNPGIFKPQVSPVGNDFCAVNKYYVVNEFGVALDSITVLFKTDNANCNLSVDKEVKEIPFSVYPNPAQDFVTVKGDELKNGGTVVFLDALGKEVKRASVKAANTSIAVNDLKRGVYFVNVYGTNGSKSNIQRLIIQ